jgi:hypothetical protein
VVSNKRATFEERVRRGEGATSIINEPIDFSIDFEVKGESATARARRRWRCEPELISGEDHER